MKAIIYLKYGSPDVLQLRDVVRPVPQENEVLVQIHAASLNSRDLRMLAEIAESLGITPGQLDIAWILRRKEVSSVITGATRVEQLDENLSVMDAVDKLANDVLEKIDKAVGGME